MDKEELKRDTNKPTDYYDNWSKLAREQEQEIKKDEETIQKEIEEKFVFFIFSFSASS